MSLKPEMQWRADPNVDAARRLPDWQEFHRLCGSGSGKNLCFDHPAKEGRAYVVPAFRIKRNDHGGYNTIGLGEGRGPTVIDAVFDAYRKSGIEVPGVEELIDRRLGGPAAAVATEGDDFDSLLPVPDTMDGDDFEGLLA